MTPAQTAILWVGVAGLIVPTIAVLALIVRLGSILKTIQRLEEDARAMAAAVTGLNRVATELQAWRDASKSSYQDLVERVRRLEDLALDRQRNV